MNPILADGIGLAGSGLMVAAYAYSNLAKRIDYVLFNLLNLIGSIGLMVSLLIHFNLASFSLEVVWMMIALFGLAKALWTRRREQRA